MGHLLTILNKAISRILFRDDFNRTDAATLGSPWVYFNPSTWSILSNKAYANAGGEVYACYQSPTPNVAVSANITFASNEGLALRLSDAGNSIFFRINSTTLGAFRFVGGVATQIGTYPSTFVVGTTYAVKAVCNGSSIRIFLNGTEIITINNETFNLTQTLFGLRSSNTGASGKFDDFLVEAL